MMVLRPRQGNLRQVFRFFGLLRDFAEHETNNLKTSLRFPCRGLNIIIDYFSHTSSFFFFISTASKCLSIVQYAS